MGAFWRTWLWGWCWAVALFGVLLMGAAFEAAAGPVRLVFGAINPGAPFELDAQARFTLALLGAVTLGWALTFVAAISAAHQIGAGAGRVWRLITLSVVTWYVVDSALSIATGYALNAVPNTVFLIAFLLPVLRSGALKG